MPWALTPKIGDALLRELKAGGVDTYGALAFICAYVPGQGNENVLFDAAKDVIGRDLTNPEKIIVRRLFFESHTMAIADMKQRFEREDTAEPSKIPMPERLKA